jgi:hypothetical protein
MKRKSKRLATLTLAEDSAWIFAFCLYLDDGKTDLQADRLAWRDLKLEFPRLKEFQGCLS